MEEQFRPVVNGTVQAVLSNEGKTVASGPLTYRRDSQGIYEGRFEGLTEPGKYNVELSGPEVQRLLAAEGKGAAAQTITISPAGNTMELGDLTVDRDMASRLASLSGGVVTGLADMDKAVPLFGPGTKEVEEQRETSLWDNWIILAVAVAALTAEWILRRRHALA